ncbi:MAG: type II toxin-antitoxin system Phd/YefM family antitoxin [Thermoguttaceae bacterium]|nr:type II toxin-antitoxin system Phd/YefM family antitoxin [Thermoguttaceae bacterium]MDW8039687.1 type II toxin-antitoxin system prevent-host-death family antitoxin [Thermoguttaceae bacterium]
MKAKARRCKPKVVVQDGQPVAVILDIDHYQELLERLEDVEDLQILMAMRKKPLRFRKLEEFLQEYPRRV